MKILLKIIFSIIFLVVLTVASIWIYIKYFGPNSVPNWHVEINAIPTDSHPLSGFYKKNESCKDSWGLAVGPVGDSEYYISFCGPGGCFAEGTYRPNTAIFDDPDYKVIDENTINILSDSGWSKNVRCPSRI